MRKKYRNEFYSIIRDSGLDVRQFAVSDQPGVRRFLWCDGVVDEEVGAFTLRFHGTELVFEVREGVSGFDYRFTRFSPGFPSTEHIPEYGNANIDTVYDAFRTWLKDHVQEYIDDSMLPDLWEQIEVQKPFISAAELNRDDVSKFTEEEKDQLRLTLSAFRLLVVETFKPTEERVRVIEARLDYLSKALDRLNRFDWKSVLLSSAVTISATLSLNTEQGKVLLNLLKSAFSHVFRLLK
jgi:hypothetical protein